MKRSRAVPIRDWITPEEAAELLRMSGTRVRWLARAGRIVAESPRGFWLLYLPSVLEHRDAPPLPPGRKAAK